VPTVTVDEFAVKSGLTPHFIKIDVEGAELLVLRGAREIIAAAKPTICLSIHSPELRLSCLDYLRQHGYSFRPLDGELSNANEYLASVE
jgi:hypothetical protein